MSYGDTHWWEMIKVSQLSYEEAHWRETIYLKKYINDNNKKHAKKNQVLISDLKSVQKNTI